MVDSTNLPNVDINQIATDLNNKLDRDCLNYSDTGYNFMAGASMPSDTYVNLTLGASGSTYTTPANGWIFFRVNGVPSGGHISITNSLIPSGIKSMQSNNTAQYLQIFIPVIKNNIYTIEYSTTGSGTFLYFVYAQGSKSEAN